MSEIPSDAFSNLFSPSYLKWELGVEGIMLHKAHQFVQPVLPNEDSENNLPFREDAIHDNRFLVGRNFEILNAFLNGFLDNSSC